MKNTIVSIVAALVFSTVVSANAANPKVKFETTSGVILVELNAQAAPKTVANFLQYVKDGHYNGTVFHRVIKGFMIQGGGMKADMSEKSTRPPVANEADNGLKNEIGTIAMARTMDPNSATAQFFINTVNNVGLNFRSKDPDGWGYCVFGKVVGGMSTVKAIESVATKNEGMYQNVPITPIEITKATIVEATPATTSKPSPLAPKDSTKK